MKHGEKRPCVRGGTVGRYIQRAGVTIGPPESLRPRACPAGHSRSVIMDCAQQRARTASTSVHPHHRVRHRLDYIRPVDWQAGGGGRVVAGGPGCGAAPGLIPVIKNGVPARTGKSLSGRSRRVCGHAHGGFEKRRLCITRMAASTGVADPLARVGFRRVRVLRCSDETEAATSAVLVPVARCSAASRSATRGPPGPRRAARCPLLRRPRAPKQRASNFGRRSSISHQRRPSAAGDGDEGNAGSEVLHPLGENGSPSARASDVKGSVRASAARCGLAAATAAALVSRNLRAGWRAVAGGRSPVPLAAEGAWVREKALSAGLTPSHGTA